VVKHIIGNYSFAFANPLAVIKLKF